MVAEVRLVGNLRVFVPFRGENASATDGLESLAESADASEEIDEGEVARLGCGTVGLQPEEVLHDRLAHATLSGFPTRYLSRGVSSAAGDLVARQAEGLPQSTQLTGFREFGVRSGGHMYDIRAYRRSPQ